LGLTFPELEIVLYSYEGVLVEGKLELNPLSEAVSAFETQATRDLLASLKENTDFT
jgi:hypothetical protein